jgi:hypothetical protein
VFISDKIEVRGGKREVMCIHFGCPTKKNELGWASSWEGSHGQSWSSMGGAIGGGAAMGSDEGAQRCCSVLSMHGDAPAWGRRTRRERRKRKERKGEKEKLLKLEILEDKNKR